MWNKMTENKPENSGFDLVFESSDYYRPHICYDFVIKNICRTKAKSTDDLHFLTKNVLVRRKNSIGEYAYFIDRRRKFDSYSEWIWTALEGVPDEECEWMVIPD